MEDSYAIERWDDSLRGTENGDPRMNQVRAAIAKALSPPLLTWAYLASYYKGRENREIFDNVQTYCMFIGYPRSGHSLVSARY